MLIKVTKTTKAASCSLGIKTKIYEEGNIYDIFDKLAKIFVENDWGVKYEKIEEKSLEEKSLEAPENKAFNKAPENKKNNLKNKK